MLLFLPSCDATRSRKGAISSQACEGVSLCHFRSAWKGCLISSGAAAATERMFSNVHAMLPSSCVLKLLMHRLIGLANTGNSCASQLSAFANAQAKFERPCALKFPICHSAALANATNSCASDRFAIANAHAVLARPCTLKSPRRSLAALTNAAKSCA